MTQQLAEHVMKLFEANIDVSLKWIRGIIGSRELVPTVDSQLIESLCAMFISLLPQAKLNTAPEAFDDTSKVVNSLFFFCLIWSVGASIDESHWPSFDEMIRDQ